MSNFDKVVRIGTIPTDTFSKVSVFCRIEFANGRLSIVVIGNTNASAGYFYIAARLKPTQEQTP